MDVTIYIPPSLTTAEKHLALALRNGPGSLTRKAFLRAWCSLAYLYPGLHPDGYNSRGSGWPKSLKPMATEAWRRYTLGKLSDDEIYCYEASKARLVQERGALALESAKKPWLFTDHFGA